MVSKPEQIADPIETFDYCDAEIVIGLVCAVGTDYGPIREVTRGEDVGSLCL